MYTKGSEIIFRESGQNLIKTALEKVVERPPFYELNAYTIS